MRENFPTADLGHVDVQYNEIWRPCVCPLASSVKKVNRALTIYDYLKIEPTLTLPRSTLEDCDVAGIIFRQKYPADTFLLLGHRCSPLVLVPNNYCRAFRQSYEARITTRLPTARLSQPPSHQPDCAIWIPENPEVKYRLRHTQAQFCFGVVLRSDLWVKASARYLGTAYGKCNIRFPVMRERGVELALRLHEVSAERFAVGRSSLLSLIIRVVMVALCPLKSG